ncbi:GrpB family protein [Guptibacillus algicola]|uniref:GrpB family protein n=1 Tax=Guptibacillus algicola TaxID=225844 RepID=UPI001CD20099|nr:GrpB family protein [Alkalihalobacillus algicola]MCA0987135.1 GrpB family protein [Alkalihalobacillus algicola]
MKTPTVHLVEYDVTWKKTFEEEKQSILHAVQEKVVAIEHIGSTSIEGLSAKPIIDIAVGVHHLDEVDSMKEPLERAGYEYIHKPELEDRRFFRKGGWGNGKTHVHVCEYGGSQWKEKLAFRDYLRAHPALAKEYEELKQTLASRYKDDRPTYTSEKEPFIKKVLERAKDEAGKNRGVESDE